MGGGNFCLLYWRHFFLPQVFLGIIYIYIYAQTGTFADPTVRCFKAFFDLCSFVRFVWCFKKIWTCVSYVPKQSIL